MASGWAVARRRIVALAAGVAIVASAFVVAPDAQAKRHGSTATGQRVEALLDRMTLDEKVRLMYGVERAPGVHSVGYVPGVERLGIPPLLLSDGPVGVKDSCFGGTDPANCKLGQSTALPASVAVAASFDERLARDYGRVLGAEARARGVDVLYGPAMDIVRVPQGGRNFEYFSEDPWLTGRMAVGEVEGIQSQKVAAQMKHWALNNQELDRHETTSNADERTIRELYLPAYEAGVKEAGADSIMCANNAVNGTYNCENGHLQREILKGEWNWGGVIGSDYAATRSAIGSVNGGLDQAFTGRNWGQWYKQLPDLVRSGQVSEALIDAHVRRILRMEIKLGMLDDPDRHVTHPVDVTGDGAFTRTVAERGAVLLKNDTGDLPLDAASLHSIAVVGEYAGKAYTGGGGSSHVDPYYSVSPVEGIRGRVGPDVQVTTSDGKDVEQAAALARDADVAVVVVNDTSSEGSDRANIDLPGNQDQLVEAVAAANPRTIVVLNTGSAVTMPWLSDVHALLEMWYPGEEDGNALAALLFGDVNPSGKLPVTFPVDLEQDCCHAPPRYPHDADGIYDYSERLQVGYRWYDANDLTPLFPFGFGLSYTTFAYRNLQVTPVLQRSVQVSVDVANTGDRAGAATPQAYLGFPQDAGEPPHKLVAAKKVWLQPGEHRQVTMTVPRRAFAIWNEPAHNWDVPAGDYTVSVGSSSRDLPLIAPVHAGSDEKGAQGIAVHAPELIRSGSDGTVTVDVTNTGEDALANPRVGLRVPHGWTAEPTRSPRAAIPAHGSATFAYRVGIPADAGPATWVLTATARWDGAAAGSATRAVSVRASGAPHAEAGATPTNGQAPLAVHFSSAGSDDPDPGDSLRYAWDFQGDGATDSTDPNPTFTYTSNGEYHARLTVTDSPGMTGVDAVTIIVGNTAPTLTFQEPPNGGFFSFGDKVDYDIAVADPDGGDIDCSRMKVTYFLGHDDHRHELSSATGCRGTIEAPTDGQHSAEDDTFGVLHASYSDGGANGLPALTGEAELKLQPHRKQGEYYTSQHGVQTEATTDPQGGGRNVSHIDPGDWISFAPMNLRNITSLSYRAASAGSGGQVQVHVDSPTGPVISTGTIPVTGGWQRWTDVSNVPITDPGGTHELFFVFENDSATKGLFNINWIDFNGPGVGHP